MKKTNYKLAKKYFCLTIPLINLISIIFVGMAFSGQNLVEEKKTEADTKNIKNEINIPIYFHKTNETHTLNIEEYLIGVVPAEMPPTFDIEALKAQAVAARTFIINKSGTTDNAHKDAVVCTDSAHCKAYITEEEAKERWGIEWEKTYKNKIKKAISETCGEIVTYDDQPISAVFHSTSSGMTENSEDVWQEALPYLRSVVSEGEEESPRYTSNVKVTLEEFKSKLQKEFDDLILDENYDGWIGNITFNESGSVKDIVIGNKKIKGTDIRKIFSLRSTNFKINIDDAVSFDVIGNGHGVGMSQYGANHAAKNGYTYDKILKKYYSGTEIKKYE